MTTAADPLTDPELLDTEWDLDPLVDGEGRAGAERMLEEAASAPRSSPRPTPARSQQLDAAALQRRDGRARRDQRADRARRLVREPPVRHRHGRPSARSAAAARPGARHRDRDAAAVLRARVGRARRRPRRGAARLRRARPLPPSPAQRAALPPAPALGERGEDPRREVDLEPGRVGPPVRRAARRAAGRPRRRGADARDRAQPPPVARPRGPPRRRGRGVGCARARAAHPRLHLQHARVRQVGRGPAPPLPELAREPQPGQRGLRRVGDGADRGGPQSLRHPSAVVRAQGQAARHRPARRLRPRRTRTRRGPPVLVRRGARPRARHLPVVLARGRQDRAAVLRRALDRRPDPPPQARRRVLRLHRAERPPVRDAQLHRDAPRRADDGARARARAARRARPASGRVPPIDAADARRDRVGVRRGARVRPDARRRHRRRAAGSACSPSGSTARSPPCSARWR